MLAGVCGSRKTTLTPRLPKSLTLGLRDRYSVYFQVGNTRTVDGKFDVAQGLQRRIADALPASRSATEAFLATHVRRSCSSFPMENSPMCPAAHRKIVLDGFTVPVEAHQQSAPTDYVGGQTAGSTDVAAGTAPGTSVRPARRCGRTCAVTRRDLALPPEDKSIRRALNSGITNPWWARLWTNTGNRFVNTVDGHLWHGITGAHLVRGSTIDPNRHVYELIDQHADHWHFDAAQHWTKSRDGAANALGGGDATYRGHDLSGRQLAEGVSRSFV